jgi:hypothetical protein
MSRLIIGYGEDALTYWAISLGLPKLLSCLFADEPSNLARAENCLVFYRPSFGRGNGFGEFDAILVTPGTVFLIESKWHPPNQKVPANVDVKLRQAQVNRHKTWKGHWDNWRGDSPLTISPKRLLHSHLTSVFQRIDSIPEPEKEIQNVCLYFIPEGNSLPKVRPIADLTGEEIISFRGVGMHYPLLDSQEGFIGLSGHHFHHVET